MNRTTKTISYITVILLVSKLFGFVREMVVAGYYGATWQTDAYNMAIGIINLFVAVLSMSVATVVIPMYNHRLVQKSKKEADAFAGNILCITSAAYGVLSLLGIISAPVLIKMFAPSFDAETAALSLRFIRIMFMFTLFSNAVNFLGAISRANKRFFIPSLVSLPVSVSVIFFVTAFSGSMGIYALVAGYIAGTLMQAAMIILSLKNIFEFKPMFNFRNGDVKEIVILCLPILVSIGVDEINVIVDKILASGLVEGSITAMNYATKLRALPHGIITAAVISVILPMFSRYAAKQDFGGLKNLAVKSMSGLFAIMLPVTLVCMYFSREIVRIVYERGAFTGEDTIITAHILVFMIPALFFMGGCQVLNNAFYGMQDTKTPRLGAVIAVIANIILNIILVRYMQAAGLALATSIARILNYIILLIFFRRKCGAFGGKAFLSDILKCSAAALFMLPTFMLSGFFRDLLPGFVFLAAASFISLGIYAVLLYILRVSVFIEILNQAKSFLRKRA